MIDNNMNPEQSQMNLEPEEAQALLAWNTKLMEGMMPQAPTEEMPQEMDNQPDKEIANLEGKFEQFQLDINKTIDDKFSQLQETIRQALMEDDSEDSSE